MRPPRAAFAARALRELGSIHRWVTAGGGVERADQVVERIVATADLLAERPLTGRERPEIAPGLRSFVAAWSYVILYRPVAGGVRVMRVVHGHRDLKRTSDHPGEDKS